MKRDREEAEAARQDAPRTPVTLFLRCAALHSRGELVNGYLYSLRETLRIASWYDAAGHLRPEAPLEVVYVAHSRRPYFLLEWRYQTSEELARQHANKTVSTRSASRDKEDGKDDAHNEEEEGEKEEGDVTLVTNSNAANVMPRVDEATLAQCAQRLRALPAAALVYKDAEVTVSEAMPGLTVSLERGKLLERDALRREQQRQQQRQQKQASEAAAQKDKRKAASATVTSFVPRTVRRVS